METLPEDPESSGVIHQGEHRGAAMARHHEISALEFTAPQPNTLLVSQEENIELDVIDSA
jgi:hypothetical protein